MYIGKEIITNSSSSQKGIKIGPDAMRFKFVDDQIVKHLPQFIEGKIFDVGRDFVEILQKNHTIVTVLTDRITHVKWPDQRASEAVSKCKHNGNCKCVEFTRFIDDFVEKEKRGYTMKKSKGKKTVKRDPHHCPHCGNYHSRLSPCRCKKQHSNHQNRPCGCKGHHGNFHQRPCGCKEHHENHHHRPCGCKEHHENHHHRPCGCKEHRENHHHRPCGCKEHHVNQHHRPCGCKEHHENHHHRPCGCKGHHENHHHRPCGCHEHHERHQKCTCCRDEHHERHHQIQHHMHNKHCCHDKFVCFCDFAIPFCDDRFELRLAGLNDDLNFKLLQNLGRHVEMMVE